MRFSLLLLILSRKLKKASRKNAPFRTYINTMRARVLVKSADGRRGRLFIFDRGTVSSMRGGNYPGQTKNPNVKAQMTLRHWTTTAIPLKLLSDFVVDIAFDERELFTADFEQ